MKQTIKSHEARQNRLKRKLRSTEKEILDTNAISLTIASNVVVMGGLSMGITAIPTAPIVVCLSIFCSTSTSIAYKRE